MYLTGLLTRRPTAQVIHSSGVTWSLPPKPPPTSGAITRIFDSETPVVAASANRTMCGIWVDVHIVYCSPVGSTTTERGSMNAGISRCWRYSRSITMPSVRALAIASSTLPPVPASAESKTHRADLLVPRSGWARTLSSAASLRSSAAGSSSYSTSTSSAASRASAARAGDDHGDDLAGERDPVGSASASGSGVTWSVVIGQALMQTPSSSPKSLPVNTSTTLVMALAAVGVDADLMVACANGLRTIARCSIPGRARLSVQRVRPVISRWSSLRRRSRPISSAGAGASWAAVMPTPPRSRRCARRRTARP